MDDRAFDNLSQFLAGGQSRRATLGALLAAGTAGAAFAAPGAEAGKKQRKRRKKKKKKKACQQAYGKPCTTDKTCCTGKTNLICAVPITGSNSDTFCCGGANATCGGVNGDGDAVAPVCCVGFVCNALVPGVTGTCQPQPPEM